MASTKRSSECLSGDPALLLSILSAAVCRADRAAGCAGAVTPDVPAPVRAPHVLRDQLHGPGQRHQPHARAGGCLCRCGPSCAQGTCSLLVAYHYLPCQLFEPCCLLVMSASCAPVWAALLLSALCTWRYADAAPAHQHSTTMHISQHTIGLSGLDDQQIRISDTTLLTHKHMRFTNLSRSPAYLPQPTA